MSNRVRNSEFFWKSVYSLTGIESAGIQRSSNQAMVFLTTAVSLLVLLLHAPVAAAPAPAAVMP